MYPDTKSFLSDTKSSDTKSSEPLEPSASNGFSDTFFSDKFQIHFRNTKPQNPSRTRGSWIQNQKEKRQTTLQMTNFQLCFTEHMFWRVGEKWTVQKKGSGRSQVKVDSLLTPEDHGKGF